MLSTFHISKQIQYSFDPVAWLDELQWCGLAVHIFAAYSLCRFYSSNSIMNIHLVKKCNPVLFCAVNLCQSCCESLKGNSNTPRNSNFQFNEMVSCRKNTILKMDRLKSMIIAVVEPI